MIANTFLGAGMTLLLGVLGLLLTSAVIVIATLLKPGLFGTAFERTMVSSIVDSYLRWRYPIYHTHDKGVLPGTKYQWPDGDGALGKSVMGRKNGATWQNQYGDIYRIWVGMTPEVVICRPDQLSIVYKDSDKHSKAVNAGWGWLMSRLLGECMGLLNGTPWKTFRNMTDPPFRHEAALNSIEQVQWHVKSHFAELEKSENLTRGLIHPIRDFKMLPFFIIAQVVYGPLSAERREKLQDMVPARERLFRHVVFGGLPRFSFSRFLSTAANRELKAWKQFWRQFNADAYTANDEKRKYTLVHQMYTAADRGEMSYEQVDQTLDEMLYANMDATTGGLSWNLIFLAANQDIQARLRDEIDRLRSRDEEKAYISRGDTFLAACILESSRLRPGLPFSIAQAAPTDRVVDGWLIPKGTMMTFDTWAINVRSEYWAPDNTTYRPERFLTLKPSDLRYNFWRFGFGPRQCTGKYFADIIIRATLLHLIQNYTLDKLQDADCATDPECWVTHPDLQVNCTRRNI